MNEVAEEKYHKETFDKISKEKQEKIFQAAVYEFAQNGFSAANINTIAKRAEISIGSLYNYFSSKEDLYLWLVNNASKLLEEAIAKVDLSGGTVFDKLERLMNAAFDYSKKYPELHQIYLDMSTEGLSYLSKRLSYKMESITARYYRAILNDAKKKGIVSEDVDEFIASFCIDNLMMFIQFSYTSKYFIERMKIFMGEDDSRNDEAIIKGMMKFIRRALEVKE